MKLNSRAIKKDKKLEVPRAIFKGQVWIGIDAYSQLEKENAELQEKVKKLEQILAEEGL